MTIYCGVDFHARVQTVCSCDLSDGEVHSAQLNHQPREKVREFYSALGGEVIVGLEATGYSRWFEQLLEELGHQVWIGDATEIRRLAKRRQKTDARDAALILDLLLRQEFPRVHRPSNESLEVLSRKAGLRWRHRLVKMRTMVKNSLQAIAIGSGLPLRARLLSQSGRARFERLPLSEALSWQRQEWLWLHDQLGERITKAEQWLEGRAEADARVRLVRTQPGVGLLTSLALVHTLWPVSRFPNLRKVVAYVGLEPMERSSAGKKRYLGISKAGSRLLRFLLVEAGHIVIRHDETLKRFYLRLVHRRGAPKARIAVARKVLVRSFIMLRDQIESKEFDRRGVEARSARVAHGHNHA